MNPKIVVDHELFTTCRLCLEEKGKYQIVPVVQENIKFVFDIEVELNNGLPQLICVNCEKLLSNFVCTKQLFQEKQKQLQKRLQSTTGTPQGNSITKAKQHHRERLSSHSNEDESDPEQERVVVPSGVTNTKLVIKKTKKTHIKSWRSSFVKQFGCRLCSEKFKKKDEIDSHIAGHKRKITNTCFVRLERFDDKPNITGSTKFVVLNNNKIVRNKRQYYIVYTYKSNHSDSSEDEVFVPKKKYKRLKLDSGSSNDTLLIDESDTDIKTPIKTDEMNETTARHARAPSSASDSSSQPPSAPSAPAASVIDTLITVCYNNLLKKMESTTTKNAAEKSQLRHKFLSIGSKIVNTNPINCTGILRYLEYRNLEVNFVTNSKDNNYVRIRTKLKCKKEKSSSTKNWKSLRSTSISEPTSDFFDVLKKAEKTTNDFSKVFRKVLTTETVAADKTPSPARTVAGVLLNSNPVPNPKKLPRKNEESSPGTHKSPESESTRRDSSTGTTIQSASSTTNGAADTAAVDRGASTPNVLPRLKLKPVHELMASRDQRQECSFFSQPFHCYAGPAPPPAPHMLVRSFDSGSNGQAPPKFINIAPAPAPASARTLAQIGNTMTNGAGAKLLRKPEYVVLDTVEFPNTTTSAPFTYFKNLLQVNNLALLESCTTLGGDFCCLIKLKLKFQQENVPPVELCVSLYSNASCFCIKVANFQGADIDINEMSANWQWEIMKAFGNEVVPRLVSTARSISLQMYESVQKFVRHLKSIKLISY